MIFTYFIAWLISTKNSYMIFTYNETELCVLGWTYPTTRPVLSKTVVTGKWSLVVQFIGEPCRTPRGCFTTHGELPKWVFVMLYFHGWKRHPYFMTYLFVHDDVIKWKYFPRYWPFCAGNSPVTGEFPAQWPVTRSFDVAFDLRPNKRLSKQSWGWWFETPSRSSWRHCNENYPTHQTLCTHHPRIYNLSKSSFKELAKGSETTTRDCFTIRFHIWIMNQYSYI